MMYVLTVIYVMGGPMYEIKFTTTSEYQTWDDCNVAKDYMVSKLNQSEEFDLKLAECRAE